MSQCRTLAQPDGYLFVKFSVTRTFHLFIRFNSVLDIFAIETPTVGKIKAIEIRNRDFRENLVFFFCMIQETGLILDKSHDSWGLGRHHSEQIDIVK